MSFLRQLSVYVRTIPFVFTCDRTNKRILHRNNAKRFTIVNIAQKPTLMFLVLEKDRRRFWQHLKRLCGPPESATPSPADPTLRNAVQDKPR